MENRKEWLAPLTGLAFVALLIASFAVGGEPKEASDGAQEVVDFYSDNKESVQAGAAIGALAAVAMVFFFAYLRRVLIEAGQRDTLPTAMLVGAGILATGIGIDTTLLFAAAEAAEDVDPSAILAIQTIWDNDFFPLAIGVSVILWSAGISVVRSGALPKWLGWIAIALAVISLSPIGFVAAMGLVIWILIASILLTVRARGGASAPPAAA
jgi:hypothetical protein